MSTKAEMLRDLRLNKRLTQQEVADKLKISQATYSATERGLKPRAIKEALEVVSRMRLRSNRTDGGEEKTGRLKS